MGIAVAFGSFLIMSFVLQIAVIGVAVATGQLEDFDSLADTSVLTNSPFGLLALLGGLAVGIPAAMLAIRLGHQLSPALLSSVRGYRWGLQAQTVGIAVATFVVFLVANGVYGVTTTGLPEEPSGSSVGDGGVAGATTLLLVLVVVVMVPLQAAGEEYMFRGYLLQAIGSWLPSRRVGAVLAVVLTSVGFAALHTSNGEPNVAAYVNFGLFGVVTAVLTIRTGGLEGAIAMHAVNNVVGFLAAVLAGDTSEPLDATGTPWSYVILSGAWMIGYAMLVDWLVRRRQLPRVTIGQRGLAPTVAPG